MENVVVLSSFQKDVSEPTPLRADGAVAVRIEDLGLMPGTYYFSAGVVDATANIVDWVDRVVEFEVLPQHKDGRPADRRLGFITRKLAWTQQA